MRPLATMGTIIGLLLSTGCNKVQVLDEVFIEDSEVWGIWYQITNVEAD